MNILYINHYAGSVDMGMEFRPYYLAREWVKMGHKVTIVAGDYSHLRKNNPSVQRDFQTERIDGIEYVWIRSGAYSGNGAKRAISMVRFVGKLYLHARKIAKTWKPDIVIASSTYPLDTYPAYRIARLAGAKYVHEVHDMWPITPMELYGMSKWHPFVVIMQWAENFFCRHADKIVSILPCAETYFRNHGMPDNTFVHVSNGVNLKDWSEACELPTLHQNAISNAKKAGKTIILFFGSHTRSYSLDYLLQAAAKIRNSSIFLLFVGEGNYKEELIQLASTLGLAKDSYVFLPAVLKKSIPTLISQCDVSYVGAIKNKMFRFGIGMNKLFDAMMGGKPILYAVDAPNNMVEENKCGISVPSEDSDALASAITRFLQMPPEEREQMGRNGRKAVLENYTYDILAAYFIKAIND